MLKGYLDLGAKSDPGDEIVCVGSVVFKPVRYKQFIRPWERMLKEWGASAFHATDFYVGAEQFKRDTPEKERLFRADSKRIPRMIGETIRHVEMVSFRPEEFNRTASPEWKATFGTSIHSQAVQLTLIANGWWADTKCPSERFAYFMEAGDPDEGTVIEAALQMKRDAATQKVVRISSFTATDKGTARGLEAADFVAWHWNKYYMDKIRNGKEDEPRKDFAAFVGASKEKIQHIFLTGDNLSYFFSVVPKQVLKGKTHATSI